MMQYLQASPYGRKYHLTDFDGLIAHLERRKILEHRIIEELFQENSIILRAKKYNLQT